jgi:hypothetical protein
LSRSKNIFNCEIHWIIKKSSDMILIITNIVWISIEDFTHLKDTRCLSIFTPKIFGYFRDRVNSNSIKSKSINLLFDPSL